MKKHSKKKSAEGELLYGVHPLLEILKAKNRKIISIYTTRPEPKSWGEIEKIMPSYHVPIQYIKRDVLSRMVGTTDHQSLVTWVQPFGLS